MIRTVVLLAVANDFMKTIQEILTLAVFAGFSIVYLKEALRWNHLVAFLLIAGAAYFMFKR